jgi:hypothetical protein
LAGLAAQQCTLLPQVARSCDGRAEPRMERASGASVMLGDYRAGFIDRRCDEQDRDAGRTILRPPVAPRSRDEKGNALRPRRGSEALRQ